MTNRLLLMLAFLLVNCVSSLSAQTTAQRQQQQQRYQQQQRQQQRQQQQYQRQQQIQARQQRLQQLQMRQQQMLRQQQQILNSRQQAAQARINANNRTNALNRQRVVRRQQAALKLQQQNAINKQIAADRIGRSRAFASSRVGTVSSVKKTIPPAKSPLVIETKTSLKTNQLPTLRAKLLASTSTPKQGPVLPSPKANTFLNGKYHNLQASGDEVFYRYHGIDNKTGKEYTFVTKTKFASERDLRQNMAILKEWDVKMDYVTTVHPPKGVWISEGVAAPQKGKFGETLPGGGYQALIETDSLHPFTIVHTEKVSEGFDK